MDAVRFEAGDTDLPNTSAAVGPSGAMMVSAAVHNAATTLRDQLIAMAVTTPAAGSARQPHLGLKGLPVLVPVAVVLAYGAGGGR